MTWWENKEHHIDTFSYRRALVPQYNHQDDQDTNVKRRLCCLQNDNNQTIVYEWSWQAGKTVSLTSVEDMKWRKIFLVIRSLSTCVWMLGIQVRTINFRFNPCHCHYYHQYHLWNVQCFYLQQIWYRIRESYRDPKRTLVNCRLLIFWNVSTYCGEYIYNINRTDIFVWRPVVFMSC